MSVRERFASIMLKRLFDIVMAFAGLVLLSPVLMVVAVLIKLDSAGPVLFRQRRVGRGLRCFILFKFRTMIQAHGGGEITVADDCRITRLGRLLRLAKLDELPQLWNILAGDMSFVGPRPLVESTVNRFRADYRWILGKTRPGVTDPASIKYRHESAILGACVEPVDYYFRVIMPDKIRLQKEYLRRQSALGDVMILCRTLAACCRLEEASADGRRVQAAEVMRAGVASLRPQAMVQAGDGYADAWRAVSSRRAAPLLDESTFPEFPACLGEAVEARSWEMDAR
jgi:lipopolysaccharide/colanic/teichoic acid biosynthesis glycosyltransferase